MHSRLLASPPPARLSLSRLFRRIGQRHALRRERRRLAALDDHLLRDIGLDREQAEREARRSDWDAPRHWVR